MEWFGIHEHLHQVMGDYIVVEALCHSLVVGGIGRIDHPPFKSNDAGIEAGRITRFLEFGTLPGGEPLPPLRANLIQFHAASRLSNMAP